MKLFIKILFMLLHVNSYSQYYQDHSLSSFNVKGEIKEIKTTNFNIDSANGELRKGKIVKPTIIGSIAVEILKFDTLGLLKSKINLNSQSKLDIYYLYSYNSNNKLLEITI